MKKVAIIHHSNGRKERCIMKKIAIISTGLFFGLFVFLTGFPMVTAEGGPPEALMAPGCKMATAHGKIGTLNGRARLELGEVTDMGGATMATIVMVLTSKGDILLFDTAGNKLNNEDEDPSLTAVKMNLGDNDNPIWIKVNTISTVVPTTKADPCVTVNGRRYCW